MLSAPCTVCLVSPTRTAAKAEAEARVPNLRGVLHRLASRVGKRVGRVAWRTRRGCHLPHTLAKRSACSGRGFEGATGQMLMAHRSFAGCGRARDPLRPRWARIADEQTRALRPFMHAIVERSPLLPYLITSLAECPACVQERAEMRLLFDPIYNSALSKLPLPIVDAPASGPFCCRSFSSNFANSCIAISSS